MSELPASGVTQLLLDWRQGDRQALDKLTPIVYQELRQLARRYMRHERTGHVLQTTALVHEAYLRLIGLEMGFDGRQHFFAVAARLMRRVLVDFARQRQADKRGGGSHDLSVDEIEIADNNDGTWNLLALDGALRRLAKLDERKSKIIELRFFSGLTIEQTGEVLEISHATVERDLRLARAWLSRELGDRR